MKSQCVLIPEDQINTLDYPEQFTSCLIANNKGEIFIQKRPDDWWTYPSFHCLFGGKCEINETAEETIIRELKEELNLDVAKKQLTYLGAITEPVSEHKELIHQYYYFLEEDALSDCFEGELRIFKNIESLQNETKLMDDVLWNVEQCIKNGLF